MTNLFNLVYEPFTKDAVDVSVNTKSWINLTYAEPSLLFKGLYEVAIVSDEEDKRDESSEYILGFSKNIEIIRSYDGSLSSPYLSYMKGDKSG